MSKEGKEDVFKEIDINDIFAGQIPEKIEESPEEKQIEIPIETERPLDINVEHLIAKQIGIKEEKDEVKDTTEQDTVGNLPKDIVVGKTKDTSSSLQAVLIAQAFNESGGLSNFDKEVFNKDIEELGEAGALINLLKKEVDYNVEGYKNSLSEDQKEFLDSLEKGVPFEVYKNAKSVQLSLNNIKEDELDDNEDLRKEILFQYFQATTSYNDEKIGKMVKRIVDNGDDIEEAKANLQELQEMSKDQIKQLAVDAENNRKAQEENRIKQLDNLKTHVYENVKEIFPGVVINKITKDKMLEAITKPVREVNGNKMNAIWALRSEDPISFDTKLAYLFVTDFFKGKTANLPGAKTKTEAFKELENSLARSRSQSNPASYNLNDSGTSIIESLKKDKKD